MVKNMPKNWEPPVPAWKANFAEDVDLIVMGCFGVQRSNENIDIDKFTDWFKRIIKLDNGPLSVERARFTDPQGYINDYFITYWTDTKQSDQWLKSAEFTKWWNEADHLKGELGYWAEIISFPPERTEVTASTPEPVSLSTLARGMGDPVREHAYFGSMRDRIDIAEQDDLKGSLGNVLKMINHQETKGKRVRITPPENLAMIRSWQNLSDCNEEEEEKYHHHIAPVLKIGMEYLSNNPVEVGCCSNRFSHQLTLEGGKTKKTFTYAYFLTLENLEKWSKSHPTHLAIFGTFMKIAEELGENLQLKLGHEVSVLSSGGQSFEYINCHSSTGLLPWFRPQDVISK